MNNRLDTKGIDGLRGIAAIGIAFFSHYYLWVPESNYPFLNGFSYWFWNYASYFVDLFFVISGFVMVYTYKDKIKAESVRFVDFVKKRLLRFYPMMVFSLVLLLVLQLIHQQVYGLFFVYDIVFDNSVLSFLLNLLCLQGTGLVGSSFNAPTWYLSIVLIMYMIFYVITYVSRKHNLEVVAYASMVVIGLIIAIKGYPTVLLNCRGVIGFFVGCLLCEICYVVENIQAKAKNFVVYATFVGLIAFCAISAIYGHVIYGKSDLVVVVYELVIWPALVFLAIEMPLIRNILKLKPVLFFGKISFSMYILHFPMMIAIDDVNIMFNLGMNYASRKFFVLYAIVVIVAGVLGHYFVENKLTKFLKRFV